jgi:hypothetical protein
MTKQAIVLGFLAGFGFMASQDLWWFITGFVGLCHG